MSSADNSEYLHVRDACGRTESMQTGRRTNHADAKTNLDTTRGCVKTPAMPKVSGTIGMAKKTIEETHCD